MIQSVVLALLLLPAVGDLQDSASRLPIYAQKYSIRIKGAPAGTETVTENYDAAGNLVSSSEHEIFITDGLETKRMAFVAQLILAKGSLVPISYTFRYTSGESRDSCTVAVKDGEVKRVLVRAGRSTETTSQLKPGTVILDFSVYHQYDYLLRNYDFRKGGRQSFACFVPLIGAEVTLNLSPLQDSAITFDKGSLPVKNFKIEFVGLWNGLLAADRNHRMVRVVIPAQDLDVIRGDLVQNP